MPALFLIAGLLFSALSTQDCSPCSIELTEQLRIGALDDPVGMDVDTHLARTPSGAYFVAPVRSGSAVLKYDDTTGQLVKLFADTGAGPRELYGPTIRLLVAGDTAFVVTPGRILALSEGLVPTRDVITLDLGAVTDIVPLGDGRFVASQAVLVSRGTLGATHLLAPSGDVERTVERLDAANGDRSARRRFALSRRGGFWSMTVFDSRLERRALSGDLIETIHVNRPWFEPFTGPLDSPYQVPWPGRTISVAELDEDRVLLVSLRADAEWEGRAVDPAGRPNASMADVLDWVIEIVSSRSGEVLASRVFDDRVGIVEGGEGQVFQLDEDDQTGHITAIVYDLSITGRK